MLVWLINISLLSASGLAAAVGAILIPTLIAAGVHPAMAAATVLAGTWGSAISPGNAHNPFVADLAGTDMMTVIINETPASIIASLACVAVMTAYAVIRREGATEERRVAYMASLGEDKKQMESFHVNPLRAREKGVLRRPGHTEAAVDLARLAGLQPCGAGFPGLRLSGFVLWK